jgi:hypothetical protein
MGQAMEEEDEPTYEDMMAKPRTGTQVTHTLGAVRAAVT